MNYFRYTISTASIRLLQLIINRSWGNPLSESISIQEFPVACFIFSLVNRLWTCWPVKKEKKKKRKNRPKPEESWSSHEPNCSIALIFEQISGFNRKSTTLAATREPKKKGDREVSFRSTIFSFTLKRDDKKRKGERRWRKKIMRPNGFQCERRSNNGGAKVKWPIWSIQRERTPVNNGIINEWKIIQLK